MPRKGKPRRTLHLPDDRPEELKKPRAGLLSAGEGPGLLDWWSIIAARQRSMCARLLLLWGVTAQQLLNYFFESFKIDRLG